MIRVMYGGMSPNITFYIVSLVVPSVMERVTVNSLASPPPGGSTSTSTTNTPPSETEVPGLTLGRATTVDVECSIS